MLWLTYGSDFPKIIPEDRLFDCVDTLLIMQNPDHGFGSYEKARVGTYVEIFNPAEVFDRCMVEYSYPECTTAVITALSMFRTYYPSHARKQIEDTIQSATKFLKGSQRTDGSWYGSWGICFTYGTMFALEGLAATGLSYALSEEVKRACSFLVDKQKDDGGWGEHWDSCERREYVEHEQSQVVNTAWAVLGLMAARYPGRAVIARGLEVSWFFRRAACNMRRLTYTSLYDVDNKLMESGCKRQLKAYSTVHGMFL
jgi:lanosterol synthase